MKTDTKPQQKPVKVDVPKYGLGAVYAGFYRLYCETGREYTP
jgi:hypothetical protein